MYEAIVTLVCHGDQRFDEPSFTEVYRIEFDTEKHMRDWLDTSEAAGVVADQKMGDSNQ